LFWESWSLAVEEWFYLLFPLLLFFLFRINTSVASIKKKLLLSILLFLSLPLLYRVFSVNFLPLHQDWDLYYRKLVLTRIDAMGFGLLAAFLKQYARPFWHSKKIVLFVTGCLGLFLLTYFSAEVLSAVQFSKTLYFSVSAFFVMLLLPLLDGLITEPLPFKPVAFISRNSYSLYLLHIPLFQIMLRFFQAHNAGEAVVLYGIYWALALSLSNLVFRYFEKPLMNLKKTNGE
jgi:peptidoglycan/LPS O-acetylase OafA/YrhL